ncbi:hypothetical protein FRD01_12280 [Microvenator marinus]|jgi:hypothetical protein|uniref:Uncharacterized protein n=1 Tax=Microvenator marinus TaxID=2600177 RepID=A0A5B8XT02_9DELT|nr:type II toxin-antitoxin system VapB family antitoxin [Microvenator marinus]QED27998.1 hypothetical protein FRD01_12280 [Microvenator marinus]
MNIKNDETVPLAQELAVLGESSTQNFFDEIRRIQDDYGTSDLFDPREADEILGFGEDGLP